MAGYQINQASLGCGDWTSWINATEKSWKGYLDITVNNWDTTGVPSIAKGGCMEVGGAIFYFGSTEAITGTPSTDNLNYIMMTVSSTNVAASYTTTAPSWIANKGGWYDATEAKRYIGGCGINLGMKWVYDKGRDNVMEKTLDIGDWDMDADASITMDHGLGSGWTNIRMADAMIRSDLPNSIRQLVRDDDGGKFQFTPTIIGLSRLTGGHFDTTEYASTGYNRGWVTINYKV